MKDESVLLVLNTTKADVLSIWKAHGFKPTTDEERARLQQKNPHAPQCRCKFCQVKEAA